MGDPAGYDVAWTANLVGWMEWEGTKPWHGPPMAVAHADSLPITIQDHGSPVQFRSIWVRPFEPVQPRAIGGKPNAPSASETSSSQ